ncbi:hypothetical protein TrRE_jg738 [Triparma retinervis]|uniref:Major facilitator superfamily (MFS) profile domain-containing protein n=1 Tax=Triparma retinervis TaxID=2557542 RepID=A0A9W7G132_9STRA|nr:hypothetical protein TrRE_jg738 [Triparma retinervis]
MIAGGLVGALTLCLQYVFALNSMWAPYALAFTFSMLGLNTIYSSMLGWNSDLVPPEQVGASNGVQAVLNVMGAMSGMGVFLWSGGNLLAVYGYFVSLVTGTIAITAAHVREEPQEPRRGQDRRMFPRITRSQLKESYTLDPNLHSDFYLVTVSRTFYYMGISSQTFFLYYLRDFVGISNPATGVTALTVFAQVGAALAAFPVGSFSDWTGLGRKPFIYLSCLTLALGNACFAATKTLRAAVLVAGVVGIGNGGYLAMDSALAVDTIPDKDLAARFLGIWGVASFIGTALGPLVGGPVLYLVGEGRERGERGMEGFGDNGYRALLAMSVCYFGIAARVLRNVKAR